MNSLMIEGTEDTPNININYESDIFIISGRSLPEDVSSFYKPVIDWIDEFSKCPKNMNIQIKLEYFNTATSKILLDILLKIEEIQDDSNVSFTIMWYFQEHDDDMKEAGEEYSDIVSIPFEYISY